MKRCEKRDILYRQWGSTSPRAVVLMVHGLGGHSNNWEFVAKFLIEHGIASYSIELKGFGNTEGVKGHIDSLNTYIKDVRRLYSIIKREHRRLPVFIAGESMGGLIGFLTVIKKPRLFRGLVCMSPGFASSLKFSLVEYIKMISARFYNSKKQFLMPFTNEMCTRDPECKKIMDNDKLEHKFATPRLLHSILMGQLSSRLFKHKVRTDTLFLLAGADTFVSSDASKEIFKGIRFEHKEMIEYPEMRHSLTMELGREKVFVDLLRWLNKRI
ncbi:MAG: alpha/beta fold hydrolase [Candidatus Omnitrophica bacterium]|nr:alpha/beta fold hydrolase [Candidatus Omnitrophota bacterium]